MAMLFIDLFPIFVILSQILTVLAKTEKCQGLQKCSECIGVPDCGWCSQYEELGVNGTELRGKCLIMEKLMKECNEKYREAPISTIDIIKNEGFQDPQQGKTIQLQPQEVVLNLRAGMPLTVALKFKKAKDYPIDIYYLVDFSQSMGKWKSSLQNSTVKLANEIKKITSSFQLGFGSFVDKPIGPYARSNPDSYHNGKTPPYLFKNHLPLTNNISSFKDIMSKLDMSENLDVPEGSLEALLQVMVCTKDINWRPNARRIVVLCTDDSFHTAGSGKMGGIVEPHDGFCHMDPTGTQYTHDLIFDYPSISLIRAKAIENSMNIIFAVTSKEQRHYHHLREAVDGSSVVILENSDSIINLVSAQVKNMSFAVELTHNASSAAITFSTNCSGENFSNGKSCNVLKEGEEVSFRANITVSDCLEPQQTFEIKPVGIVETLTVRLKVHCHCACENSTHRDFELNSENCSKKGNMTCGQCACPTTHYGKHCECLKKGSLSINAEGDMACKKNNEICSNRGRCDCGVCKCNQPPNPKEQITGDFCECDNFSCPGSPEPCTGQGKCLCGGICQCNAGWTGDSCHCTLDIKNCIAPGDTEPCSGRGRCECGQCMCEANSKGSSFSGLYCERCTACKIKCTSEMNRCVNCRIFKSGPYIQDNCSNCTKVFRKYIQVDDVSEKLSISEESSLCYPLETDEEGCTFQYVPYYLDNELHIFVNKEKTCPTPVNIFAISASVSGSVLLAGILLLLLWKLFTTIHDKREYEKFEIQRKNTEWGRGDNPLYRHAVTTHVNPTFEAQ